MEAMVLQRQHQQPQAGVFPHVPHPGPLPPATQPHMHIATDTTGIAAAAPQPSNGSNQSHRERRTCIACRRSKVKCDRGYPCSRCDRLDLVCLQQVNTKGRPMTLTTRKRPFEQLYDQSTSTSNAVADRKVVPESLHGGPSVASQAAFQPQLAAEIFIAKFAKLWAGGQMAGEKSISVLRSWAFWNMLHGSDCSFGALSIISKILGYEHVGHILCSAGSMACSARDPAAVPDEGSHFGYDRSLEERAALCNICLKFGELTVTCNERFEQCFMVQDECKRQLRNGLVRPEYFWARFLGKDGYKEFYESLCCLHFQAPDRIGEIIHVLGCLDRYGSELRCLVRCRLSVSESGDYYSISLLLLPVPGANSLQNEASPLLAAGELSDMDGGLNSNAYLGGMGSPPILLSSLAHPIPQPVYPTPTPSPPVAPPAAAPSNPPLPPPPPPQHLEGAWWRDFISSPPPAQATAPSHPPSSSSSSSTQASLRTNGEPSTALPRLPLDSLVGLHSNGGGMNHQSGDSPTGMAGPNPASTAAAAAAAGGLKSGAMSSVNVRDILLAINARESREARAREAKEAAAAAVASSTSSTSSIALPPSSSASPQGGQSNMSPGSSARDSSLGGLDKGAVIMPDGKGLNGATLNGGTPTEETAFLTFIQACRMRTGSKEDGNGSNNSSASMSI